jgi:hypothetical protein
MKKRILLALVVLMLAAGGAFAQMSAGFGVSLPTSWDQYNISGGEYIIGETLITTTGFGLFAFFDATYVEADIGLSLGSLRGRYNSQLEERQGPSVDTLTLSLYGKYPISMTGFTLFPMLGIQYDIGLRVEQNGNKLEDKYLADYLNRFWIKFGVGFDFNLSDSLYLRPSILYGLNFGTKGLTDTLKSATDAGYTVTNFYSGLDIRVALGFKL